MLKEIRTGKELGKGDGNKYIQRACLDCGKERWIQLSQFKGMRQLRCRSCAMKAWLRDHPSERRGVKQPNWKGGRHLEGDYLGVWLPPDDFFFPMCGKRGYVKEHRLVMAKHIGRNLHRWEIVHHKGVHYPKGSKENRMDNTIENLQLVSDDRHTQITILETRINYLEKRLTLVEAENVILQMEIRRIGKC